jgi:copper(I)-binding protein
MNQRRFAVLPAILMTGGLLAGCVPRSFPDASIAALPRGGVDAIVGQLRLDDVWVDAPTGVEIGATAPLRVALTNDSATADALIRVSTPVAAAVRLERDGRAVDRLDIPAWAQTNLERDTGLVLGGVRRPLRRGQWFPVTFTFARAGSVTVLVTAGPLGAATSGTAVQRRQS